MRAALALCFTILHLSSNAKGGKKVKQFTMLEDFRVLKLILFLTSHKGVLVEYFLKIILVRSVCKNANDFVC